jgi:hypothetical protein
VCGEHQRAVTRSTQDVDHYLESAVLGMRKPDPAITRYNRQKREKWWRCCAESINVPSPEALNTHFDHCLVSAVLCMRKPDPAICKVRNMQL